MAAAPKTEYRKTGASKVGSWACDTYEGYRSNQKVVELCTVAPAVLGFAASDFEVAEKMADFFSKLVPQGADNLFRPGKAETQGFSGVPVRRVSFAPPSTSEVTQVTRQNFPESLFTVPDGFTKEAMGMGRGRGRGRGLLRKWGSTSLSFWLLRRARGVRVRAARAAHRPGRLEEPAQRPSLTCCQGGPGWLGERQPPALHRASRGLVWCTARRLAGSLLAPQHAFTRCPPVPDAPECRMAATDSVGLGEPGARAGRSDGHGLPVMWPSRAIALQAHAVD